MKRLLFLFYIPGTHRIFWLVRFNIVWFMDLRTVEITAGLMGIGLLLAVNYGRNRELGYVVKDATP